MNMNTKSEEVQVIPAAIESKVEATSPEPEEKLPIMTAQRFSELFAKDSNHLVVILNKARDMSDEDPDYKGAVLLSKWVKTPTRAAVNADEDDIWRSCLTRINRLAWQVDNWVSGCGFDRNQLDSFTIDEINNIGDDEKVICG